MESAQLKSRKANGYTYYGHNGGGAASTLKLLVCFFGIAAFFLVVGLLAGYCIGFDEATATSWNPFSSEPVPEPPVEPIVDHFARFKVDGVRYGADYGQNTMTHVMRSRSLLSEPDTDELCANRRCCHPTNGVGDAEGQQCWGLGQSECCDMLARDLCDWNCHDDEPNVRQDHVVRPGRMRNKTCAGHQFGIGVFSDDEVTEDEVVDDGAPEDMFDLQQRDAVMTMDECGDLYESLLDDETAMYEMEHLEEVPVDIVLEEDDQVRRRAMGVFGADERKYTTDLSWPQNVIGLILFEDHSGRTRSCSGTKVSKKHILTAGSCCHGGPGSGFAKDWNWHPAARTKDEVLSTVGKYPLYGPTVPKFWITHKAYDWNLCWLSLTDATTEWMDFGYDEHTELDYWRNYRFNYWGYPGDKWGESYIKWGYEDCLPRTLSANQMHFTCDTGGMYGAGIWTNSNPVVQCVNSVTTSCWNGCTRITKDKFNVMRDMMTAAGGY